MSVKKPMFIWSQNATSILARFLILFVLNENGTLNILEIQEHIRKMIKWSPSYQTIHQHVWDMIDEGHVNGGHLNRPDQKQNKQVDIRITQAGRERLLRAFHEVTPIAYNSMQVTKELDRTLTKMNPNWKQDV